MLDIFLSCDANYIFNNKIKLKHKIMNVAKYNNGEGDLFVIMKTDYVRLKKTDDVTESYKFLNIRGEFAKFGTPGFKILTWHDRQSAEIAAAVVVKARKLISIRVLTISEYGHDLGKYFTKFCEQHKLALTKHLYVKPFMDEEARLRNEKIIYDKLFFYASTILEIADANNDEMLVIQKRLNDQHPGWSISSAARSLLGKESMDLIRRIRCSEIKIIYKLTMEQLEQAITIAENFLKIKNNNH